MGDLTQARTVLRATALTREALLDAVRNLRCYASTDKNLKVTFEAAGVEMGATKTTSASTINIEFSLEDPDEPAAAYDVLAVYGNPNRANSAKEVKLATVKGDTARTFAKLNIVSAADTFVYLKIRQRATNTDWVLTSPVWIER